MAGITEGKPTLRDLELLIDLFDALKARPSVFAAAQDLARHGWSAHPSALYRTLTEAEVALWPGGGQQLIVRGAGRKEVVIPEKARQFFENVRQLLGLFQRTFDAENYDHDTVVVGATNAVTTYHLPRFLARSRFLKKHPGASLRVREGEFEDILRWLAEGAGAIDFGIGPAILPRPGVTLERLARYRRTLIYPRGHRFAAIRNRPFPLGELATETVLLLPTGALPDFPVEKIPKPTGPGRRLTLANLAEARVWVKYGLAVTFSNEAHVIPGDRTNVVGSIDVSDQLGWQELYLYLPCRGRKALRKAARDFAEAVTEAAQGSPGVAAAPR